MTESGTHLHVASDRMLFSPHIVASNWFRHAEHALHPESQVSHAPHDEWMTPATTVAANRFRHAEHALHGRTIHHDKKGGSPNASHRSFVGNLSGRMSGHGGRLARHVQDEHSFLDIEDCRADVWGCYGNSICKTPNVDRLAASGIRFDRAYCQYVCCNPSRSSVLTGLRPHTTGVLSNQDNSRKHLPPGTKSLPQLIKAKGLYAANVAKSFHSSGAENEEDMRAFDRIEMQNRPPNWDGPPPILTFLRSRNASTSAPAPNKGTKEWDEYRRKRSDRYGDSGLTDEQEHDGRVAQIAKALLKEFSETSDTFSYRLARPPPHSADLPEEVHRHVRPGPRFRCRKPRETGIAACRTLRSASAAALTSS